MSDFVDLRKYMEEVSTVCEREHWNKDWSNGGVYMHLEVSEFIEAIRGKGGDPLDELGDVLFTVLAVAEHHDLDPIDAINMSRRKHNV